MVTKQEFSNRIEYLNEKGYLHRLDGPAIEGRNGYKAWYLNGIYYSEQEWQQEVIKIKLERLKNYGN